MDSDFRWNDESLLTERHWCLPLGVSDSTN